MRVLTGRRLGSYQVGALLGAGGMGMVYLARDTRLDRDVALKVLPDEMKRDPKRLARFEREARALATLNHPNIVTIHSIEEVDGVHFLTMELVEGRPLSAALPPDGMPLERLLDTAIPLVDAVAAAHSRGIVHRDLKPDNVLVGTDGRVKVLDFGLARHSEHTDGGEPAHVATALTGDGHPVGTPAYMSPEQADGRSVDQRSDLFSLGIILYELATGHRPFAGKTPLAVLSAIHRDVAPPIVVRRPDLPQGLGRIVRRCLEKDPGRRLQSALDLRNELDEIRSTSLRTSPGDKRPPRAAVVARSAAPVRETRRAAVLAAVLLATSVLGVLWLWGRRTPSATGPIESVAVLPFVNGSGNEEADYLSNGITETLTNSLTQIRTLRVVPRTLAARYRDQTIDPRQAGRELDVRAVVTGEIVQRGDRLRIQAELIDVVNVAQLWGDRFERPLDDALAMQSELAKAIAERLRSRLTDEEADSLDAGTADPLAYQLYLKGRYAFNKRNAVSMAQATEHLEQAIARDPSYALAYIVLSRVYGTRANLGYLPPREAYPRAIAAGRAAIRLNDALAQAHAALAAAVVHYEWNWTDAERGFQRALDLAPDSPEVLHLSAYVGRYAGRAEEALARVARAEAMDPLNPSLPALAGQILVQLDRQDQAIAAARRALALEDGFVPALRVLATAHRLTGSHDEAIAESRQVIERGDPSGAALLAESYAASGRRAEATRLLAEMVAENHETLRFPVVVAGVYAVMGDADEAFVWLDRAYAEREPTLVSLWATPEFVSLRSDPRFISLVQRVGIPIR